MKKILAGAMLALMSVANAATMIPSSMINWTSVPTWPSVSAGLVFASPAGGAGAPTFRALTASDLPTVTVAKGGTGATSAGGASLDNITGFAGTGFLKRTGAGAYSFVADPLPLANGGTGAATAAAARSALGAAASGANTDITSLNAPTLIGVTNGSSASSGQVGYAPSATQSSAQSMTSSTAMNITSLSLPAGDYDVSGVGCITATGATTNMTVGISTTSATLGALGTYAGMSFTISATGGGTCIATPQVPLQLSTTTTVYLIGLGAFSSGTMTSTGKIIARVRR
ncbi:hypothetical protein KTE52_25785 [Burkholderia multivorans]|uniref:Uncharacterized protein n=1 Tax=Burkholderia multivorans TaxID=87883 RepID=A0AAP2HNJ6_9BURK|nr:hypothetical protein [Burkholderia multivorans]MBU9359754.1 hypothetical protein [Burkholderia multivorans]